MDIVIGIDGGATKTHVLIETVKGKKVGEGIGGPSNPHTVSLATVERHIRQGLTKAGYSKKDVAAVCMGIAGLDSPQDQRHLDRVARSIFPQVPSSKRLVVNDTVIARRSNSDLLYGLCIISGTGSNAYGINKQGKEAFVGGMDWLLTDAGSGYMVGREVLRVAVQGEDGRQKSLLEKLVKKKLNVRQMREAVPKIYDERFGKEQVASFAPLADVAAAKKDAVARQILFSAADDLVEMIEVLAKKLNMQRTKADLVMIGSQINKSKVIQKRFKKHVHAKFPLLSFRPAKHKPVSGAILLARDLL